MNNWFFVLVLTLLIVGYLRHLFWVIGTLVEGTLVTAEVLLMGIGTFVPPIGVIHGFTLFF